VLEGRPLYDNAADRKYFVAPDRAWRKLQTAARRGFNTLVVGPRGAGKTSLLRQLALDLRDGGPGLPPMFVDATAIENPMELIESVREALRGRPGVVQEMASQVSFAGSLIGPRPPGAASTYLVQRLREMAHDDPHLILVDASSSGSAAYQLFGRLRDELWQIPHKWVVAIDEDDYADVMKPPADAFFDVVVALPGLSDDELAQMLKLRGAGLTQPVRRKIAAASDGNPRAALQSARQAVVESIDPMDVLERQVRLETAASALGRAHSMLMAELQSMGTASASDAALLKRLGWTRERATQVFGDLEDHGLVVASQERQPRGRPRKVYRPVEDVQ
jgi:hypothetical protein